MKRKKQNPSTSLQTRNKKNKKYKEINPKKKQHTPETKKKSTQLYQDPQRNAFWLVLSNKKPPKSIPLGVLVKNPQKEFLPFSPSTPKRGTAASPWAAPRWPRRAGRERSSLGRGGWVAFVGFWCFFLEGKKGEKGQKLWNVMEFHVLFRGFAGKYPLFPWDFEEQR